MPKTRCEQCGQSIGGFFSIIDTGVSYQDAEGILHDFCGQGCCREWIASHAVKTQLAKSAGFSDETKEDLNALYRKKLQEYKMLVEVHVEWPEEVSESEIEKVKHDIVELAAILGKEPNL